MVESIRTRRAFSALSSSRRRGRSGPVWVVRADAPDDVVTTDAVHVAYAVGKAVGNAVVRNRLRRRLRALVTDLDRSGRMDPGLYLVGLGPAAVGESFAGLGAHLSRALAGVR